MFDTKNIHLHDVLTNQSLTSGYVHYLFKQYSVLVFDFGHGRPFSRITSHETSEIQRDFYVNSLNPPIQELFERLEKAQPDYTDVRQATEIQAITLNEEQINQLTEEEIRQFALSKAAIGYSAERLLQDL